MSVFVNEQIARNAAENGMLIGKTEPCRETKFSFWEVYKYNDKIIACVCTDDYGVSCGEEISVDEIGMYVDDPELALKKYNEGE